MHRRLVSFPAEVLVLISKDLEQSDLASCVLVSRAWNEAFIPALSRHIRVSQSGYLAFTSPETLCQTANNARHIHSIEASHPTFARLLLEAVVAAADRPEPWFPNLKSVSIAFCHDIHRSHRSTVPQPRFLYASDSEDLSDDDDEDSCKGNDCDNDASVSEDPAMGIYSALFSPRNRVRDIAYLTQDPYGVIQLLRQCPGLCKLKIQVRALGNMGGLNHLLWPGILPQSLVRLEIIVPNHWNEESYDNSEDEDYDPNLNPARDVEEEYEEEDEEEDDSNDGSDDGYDEDEVVRWYHARLQRPELPNFWGWGSTFPRYFNDVPRQPLLNLRELVITNAEEVRSLVWFFIEDRCPHLRSIHLIEPSGHFCEFFAHRHERVARELMELRIELKEDPDCFSEEYMCCVLNGASWRTIVLRGFYHFNSTCMETLLEKAATVEVLDLGIHAGALRSEEIQQFLMIAPRLRILSGEGLYFLARFAVQQPWACVETLEMFRCQILLEAPLIDSSIEPIRLANPDEAEQEDVAVPSPEELQRRVMEQLGRCYQLQELDLSHWTPDNYEIRGPYGLVRSTPGIMAMTHNDYVSVNANVRLPWTMKCQSQCLKFTFETGLQELEGLKKLRKVNLTGLRHRISVDELKWMREAWPQLEQFEGLISDGEKKDDDDEGGEDREDRRIREEGMRRWLEGGEAVEGDRTFWRTSGLET
ncbi:hypothetical protein BC939DRAFT_502061 [Gamsiella multidivaricata]|uniref:uncharacterized protein n=1 Tax=Gamsiella multidivaricata TaxID=101098 RepID=UPI00221F04D7|nr:uncharacterized protein BC939DRAFT_502061 [Gamsiella multidivaricata]KAI7826111.1 hypothetical protein BC939DRAFT_502061 [Gamsiella multidivaricata]